MGAILGRVALDGRAIDRRLFQRAFDRLRPGRCTRSDMVVECGSGFGHHEIGLTQPALQPLQDGSLTIVADARLYDRNDLAAALAVAAPAYSDAALILAAYRRWGVECVAHMDGDFGFAIYDRNKNELFLARDHIGARPLYWAQRDTEVIFATLLHGLTGFDDLQWPLNEARISRYLCDPFENRDESFIDGVEAVGPGCWIRISAAGVLRRRWWDPAVVPERHDITLREAQQELHRLTERAVHVRLPNDAPVGAHLSGGIDSTLITIMASQALQARGLNLAGVYAWCPPVGEAYPDMGAGDERRVISAQCQALGVLPVYGTASAKTFEALIEQPMELEGTADLVEELPVITQARNDGLGVMLSGWGGDELFSSHGIGHMAWWLRKGRLRSILQRSRRNSGLRRPDKMAAFIWRASVVPMLPDAVYRHFNPFDDIYGAGAFPSCNTKRLYRQLDRAPPLRVVADAKAYTYALLRNGHIGERMATWAAWSAPAGFEYRYPLTDRRLLEFMLSLPRDILFGDATGRFLARRAFGQLLPKGVKKDDLANTKRRHDNRMEWMYQIAEDARQGRFHRDCPWLDMPALIDAIGRKPPADRLAEIRRFAAVFRALRVYEMHVRATHNS